MGYVPDGHVNEWRSKEGHHDSSSAGRACDWICNLCKCQVQPTLFVITIIDFETIVSLISLLNNGDYAGRIFRDEKSVLSVLILRTINA